ncbi:uncharacterized protein LOC125953636 [Anopheles darlingi]|uniref:uncharacterized protein LOC125953636 n=1 Tax=Anopheles darlingi TaxID=43151 RepID=UPI0021005000|nr:uncharacterized protein LOC125953636 [Anopheles darlingi]
MKQLGRGSLANPIWHLPHGHGFDLADPLMQITRRTYHPLHDEHLQQFWRDTLKKNLTKRGLIDDDGKVVCTLQEFNEWRAFLFEQFKMSLKRCLQAVNEEKHNMHSWAYLREKAENVELLKNHLAEMELKVQRRRELLNEQHTKLDEELNHRKAENVCKRYDRRSRDALVKTILAQCRRNIRAKYPDSGQLEPETVAQAVNAALTIHTAISPATSCTGIIDTANQFVLDLQTKPVDSLPLDSLTVGYVKDRICEMMDGILHRSVSQACEVISSVAQRKCNRLNAGENHLKSSICSYRNDAGASRSMPNQKGRSKVSIGPISIVAQYEVANSAFKKCKDRPPTPITSVTSLVACTMQETELERRITSTLEISFEMARELEQRIHADDYPLIHVMYSQRRYLEGNLLRYRMIVQPYVDQRVLASIDVDQLTIDRRKWCGVSKDRLLHQTAIGLLKFPDSIQQYAKAMLDCINYLAVQAASEAQQILDEP